MNKEIDALVAKLEGELHNSVGSQHQAFIRSAITEAYGLAIEDAARVAAAQYKRKQGALAIAAAIRALK